MAQQNNPHFFGMFYIFLFFTGSGGALSPHRFQLLASPASGAEGPPRAAAVARALEGWGWNRVGWRTARLKMLEKTVIFLKLKQLKHLKTLRFKWFAEKKLEKRLVELTNCGACGLKLWLF